MTRGWDATGQPPGTPGLAPIMFSGIAGSICWGRASRRPERPAIDPAFEAADRATTGITRMTLKEALRAPAGVFGALWRRRRVSRARSGLRLVEVLHRGPDRIHQTGNHAEVEQQQRGIVAGAEKKTLVTTRVPA